MYTKKQQQLIIYIRNKVRELFRVYPSPGHALDHAVRTARYARQIAKLEKQDCFIAELCGLMHDVGYSRHVFGGKISHHEFSYEICREWFADDSAFDALAADQKKLVLYAIRYHGNDDADKYAIAWILRDADKLDGLGPVGLRRSSEYCAHTGLAFNVDLRLRFHTVAYLKSVWAKRLVQKKNLLKPFKKALAKLNRAKIKPIEL